MPDILTDYLTIALGCSGVILLVVLLAAGVWAFRDARSRSRSTAAAVVATALVLLLPVAGLVVYLLLRPRETLMETYDRALEQEALLQQIEEPVTCPGCARRVAEAWVVCPDCRTQLRRPCSACGQALDLRWQICPYCTQETGPATVEAAFPGIEPESVSAAGEITDLSAD